MDLDIRRVLAARPDPVSDEPLIALSTVWGENLDPAQVLPEHPRPEFARDEYVMLNGWWDYAIVGASDAADAWIRAKPPVSYDGQILVPFSPEAPLSGVKRQVQPDELLWYRRELHIGALDNKHCILHFDGVDWACAVYLNGTCVAQHKGAYLPFEVDITDELLQDARNELVLCVFDPSETGVQLRGKQRLARGNMWYTAQSGIWQSVWYELVAAEHITQLEITTDADAGSVELALKLSKNSGNVRVELLDREGQIVARDAQDVSVDPKQSGSASGDLSCGCARLCVTPESLHLWSLDDPYLYRLRMYYGNDVVYSYCGIRSIGVETLDDGTPRICINHRPVLLKGVLYQGYWPDGLMTAPSDEALICDLEAARKHGFTMLRLHAKTERSRFYYHASRMGILVWQDIPMGGALPGEWAAVNVPTLFRHSWRALNDRSLRTQRMLGGDDVSYQAEWRKTCADLLCRLSGIPALGGWVLFNESWGQFDARNAAQVVKEKVVGQAVVVATSGWYDQGAGDIYAVHNYFRSMRVYNDKAGKRQGRTRAFAISEFGGLTWRVDGHVSTDDVRFGYADFEDRPSWHRALSELLENMNALESSGLSAYVYTQLTDVEEETNGILTYDRKVDKLADHDR